MNATDSSSHKHVDLDNAREDDQRAVMQQIINDAQCPFCIDHLRKYHKEPILKEGKFWFLTKNQWPYEHTKVHLLAIYTSHIEDLSEINPQAGSELIELMQWAQKEFVVPGGGLAMRFGDTNYSAGSVTHLHVQFIQPDLDDLDYAPVRVKIGKSPDKLNR